MAPSKPSASKKARKSAKSPGAESHGTSSAKQTGAKESGAKETPDATALLVAAGKVLQREGIEGLTVRAIAKEAGTTTMAIYSRLGGKDGVLGAINAEGFLVLNEALSKALGDVADEPEPRILAFCRTLRNFAKAFPNHYRVMLGAPPDGYRRDAAAEERARSIWILLRKQMAGLVGEGTATMDAYALFALCHGLIELEAGPVATIAVEADAAFNTALVGTVQTLRKRSTGAAPSIDLFSHLTALEEPIELADLAWREETPRNAPCPCGSGKRYKHCHGAAAV